MNDGQRTTRSSVGLKNEDGYEISIPFENNDRNDSGIWPSDPMFDEVASGSSHPCSPYFLIISLRAQLQIALEKNSWLQKRIEDLEEERDFLRCQLDRFVFNTGSQESSGLINKESEVEAMQQSTSQKQMHNLKLSSRKTSSASSPMMTRSGKIPSRQEGEEEEVIEEEEFITEEGYVEEEQVLTDDDADDSESKSSRRGCSGRLDGQKLVKRRRVFRFARSMERQRVKDPAGVLLRYNKILVTYQKLKSMSRAFQVHGVDRNTVASTTPIAEMLLVAPEKMSEVGEFDSSKEKLLDYARRCYKALDEEAHARVQALKKNNLLLPISYRFRH
ncbi:hypothetical protein DNTS_030597 [Danionella cerebrum]|uniref:Coiled-coil domain-containing protein 106 n=1 Tax=Danionella cerebrum TaxID=2873325 RepID=A0A553RH92_9TELE|nr:hypothetical protein DNTS_030597 [Danionella translucida]